MSPRLDSLFEIVRLAVGEAPIQGRVPTLLLKATVLVLLGALVAVGLGRAGAATRHLAWTLTVTGLLVLPALRAS